MATRGCGERVDGGLYLTVSVSPYGEPIEEFLVDPVVPWNGPKALRAPMVVEDPAKVKHLIMGVGKQFYPFVPDYVEEARVMGVSKRVPKNMDLSGLIPGKSWLILMHPNAAPKFNYRFYGSADTFEKGILPSLDCPRAVPKNHLCVGDLWPLSVVRGSTGDKHIVASDFSVKTPSVEYNGNPHNVNIETFGDIYPKEKYSPGLFLRFGIFGFEFVSKSGNVPVDLAKKFEASPFKLEVVPE